MIRSDRKIIIFVKSLMGTKLDYFFYPHFLFCFIVPIRSSAQASHPKSLKSFLKTLCSVYNDMNEEFIFRQNFYGNTTRFNFFYTQFFFAIRAPGPGRHLNENLLRYDWRSSYMILCKQGNFCESKLLWI